MSPVGGHASSDLWVRDPHAWAGRVEMRTIESAALRGNRAGDPCVREVPVYLPPGWDAPGASFGVLCLLAAFTSRGHRALDTDPWRPGVVARFDRAVAAGELPPAIVVLPDAWTYLGGSQYVNSSYLGRYEDYVVDEVLPFVDEHYPAAEGRRAVLGKSSGGFGALHLAMRRPGAFRAAASISGDCCFEYCFAAELLGCARGLGPYGGDVRRFLKEFRARPDLSGDGHAVVNTLAMSACYSPAPDTELGFELPIDLHTGERRPDVWARWLAFDPVECAGEHAEALKRLALLHLEAGVRDEFNLQFGLRILARRLGALGVPFESEEHEGGHRGIDDRVLGVLPKLIAALDG